MRVENDKKYYIDTVCLNCGNHIKKSMYSKSNGFCPRPSYCRYEYMHKQRDPKGCAILDNKNDPDFYYLLGLIATDGDITHPSQGKNRGYNCNINLNKIDEDVIFKIKEKFGGNYRYNHDNTIRWSLRNKKFNDYLISIGIGCNKSKTLDVSNWFFELDFKNQIHFLRGVIDGDGSVGIYKSGRCFSICSGSKQFHIMLKKFLFQISSEGLNEDIHDTYIYIKYTNKHMCKILDLIYENINNIHISRKYNTYSKIRKFYEYKKLI